MVDLPIIQAICAVTVLPALLISLVSLYPIRFFAARLGLLDRPGGRKTHAKPIPLGGGIGIWLGTIGTFLAGTIVVALARSNPTIFERVPPNLREHLEGAWSQVGTLWALLIAGSVLVALGLWDDRRGLSPWVRLGVQFAVAGFVVIGLGYRLTAFIEQPWLTNALSIIWIVAVDQLL